MNKRLYTLRKELNIRDVQEVPSIDNITEKVNDMLNANHNEQKILMKKKSFRVVLVAAIILTITTISVLAATFHWHKKLIEYFNPTEQQMEELNGMVNAPQATATDNGITLNILQTLADRHGIYVLYEIEGLEEIKASDKLSWEHQNLKVTYNNTDKIVGLGGYAYNKILSYENNKCTALYLRTGTGEILNQKLHFELNGLRKAEIDGINRTFTKIADCNFNMEWDFQYENLGKEFVINKDFNNGKNKVTQIDISPVSIWITIKGEELDPATNMEIKFSNGEIIKFNLGEHSSYTSLHGGINPISYEFDKLINIEDVENVTVDDLIILIQ